MDIANTRADLLDPEVSTALLAVGLLLAAALWIASHAFRERVQRPPARLLYFALRFGIGTTCLWLAWQLLSRFVFLATDWTLTGTALLGALCIELTAEIYRHERRIVSTRRGRLLQSLRNAAILVVLVILLQPVWARDLERTMQRQLVILVDDSASMGLADRQLDVSERLEVAALFGVTAASRDHTLAEVERSLALLDKKLGVESPALQAPAGVSKTTADTLIAKRAPQLKAFLEHSSRNADRLARTVATQRGEFPKLSDETAALLSDYDKRIRDNIAVDLGRAAIDVGRGEYDSARTLLHGVSRQLRFVLDRLPSAVAETDRLYYDSLPEATRGEIDAAAGRSRAAIAREVLRRAQGDDGALVEQLGADYQLRFLRFADDSSEMDGPRWLESGEKSDIGSVRRTDFAAALETILQKVPTRDLAGVLVLSDGRHNGDRPTEEAARRMGLSEIPICSVLIGSKIGPKDAAVLAVRVPESIFQDDRAIIQADLKLDGLRGETATVTLLESGQPITSETIKITDRSFRSTVRFAHTPKQIGIFEYEVVVSAFAGEVFADNNRWKFQIAVSDDRTNVLLIDSYPRWEFRYLRNLFYARDKSVHLQHVLLAPDRIANSPAPPFIPASASRRFGDAEATALPASREEWLNFDAIILGDIPPSALSDEDWDAIRHCVAERGALLVTIAGPRFMPHAFDNPAFLKMLPANFEPSEQMRFNSPEPAYRLRLSADGRASLIMQQSLDPTLNAMVWGGLPPLHWRHPITEIKAAASVLAWAEPITSALTPESATNEDTHERANALILTQRYALGRSLLINFDQTWRLRYGVGDIYHHKFWGQILRWGTGEKLRAGTDLVRLGTDHLSYSPNAQVEVLAKVLDENHRPIDSGTVSVAIYARDKLLLRKHLEHRAGSNGIYAGTIEAPQTPGRYRIVLEGGDPARILATQNVTSVETEIIVTADKNALELAELTADPGFLNGLAALSGGAVATPDNAHSLLPFFRDPGRVIVERQEATLWDNFALLLLLFALLGSEWLLRRQGGLA